MIVYLNHIIIPYVNAKRKELGLNQEHPALVIFDVFKGQCTENVFQLLEENNILYVIVPNNCTDALQPLDLSINKPAKDFMKSKFQEWYGNIICKQLEDQVDDTGAYIIMASLQALVNNLLVWQSSCASKLRPLKPVI